MSIKGVILAAGTGSRLFPLTRATDEHLLPVGRYPMIFRPLNNLRVLLGDNIFLGDLSPYLSNCGKGGRVLPCESETPERFGVAELDDEGAGS